MSVVDPSALTGLRRLIGDARLSTYLAAYRGREDLALRLYSWNAALSSALWGPLGVVEVVVRNAVHEQLIERTGLPDWWRDQRLSQQLLDRERRAINDVVDTVTRRIREPSADDVIASSSFGLWVGLVSEGIPRHPVHSYETVLWQPRLRHAFPHYPGGRKQLHGELDTIRRIRNRVAHHEPIFRSSERLTEILEAKRSFIADGMTSF